MVSTSIQITWLEVMEKLMLSDALADNCCSGCSKMVNEPDYQSIFKFQEIYQNAIIVHHHSRAVMDFKIQED
jgi:hypothetical protein